MHLKEKIIQTRTWIIERHYIPELNRFMLVQHLNHLSPRPEQQLHSDHLAAVQQNKWLLQFSHNSTLDDKPVLLYEDFQGLPLEQMLTQALKLPQFFQIANELINACISLHQQGLQIQQLNPSHILIHPTSLQLKILPSTDLSKWSSPANLEDDLSFLAYIAPERTGRLQLPIDERSDLYAIGAIFYTLLIGPLFESNDIDELFFQIVTQKPDVSAIRLKYNHSLLADIIAKLLEKNPAERYQSALSLKHDLQLLQEEKLTKLAQTDNVFHPKPSIELCGRKEELHILEHKFNEVKNGDKQFVFVKGPSGSGKTSFVYQLKRNALLAHGYFVECKFDERQQQDIELMLQPLRQLLKNLYFKDKESIAAFQQAIVQDDLMVTEFLLQLLPELRVLLPATIQIVQNNIEFTRQQNTYLYAVIRKILHAIVATKQPIVWFIDDIQWADENSLDIIERIFLQHDLGHFMIVTTTRDEKQQMVTQLLNWLSKFTSFTSIHLPLLAKSDVYQWLAKSISLPTELAIYVTEKLYHFTRGNPLFMKEVFLKMLNRQALYFDVTRNSWQVNEAQFEHIISQPDLIAFIAERIQFLSPAAQHTIKLAACIGRTFSFELLQQLTNYHENPLFSALDELIDNGFIIRKAAQTERSALDQVFQFVHDRLQQTAYEEIPLLKRQQLHYTIGHLYIAKATRDHLIVAVSHFNLCIEQLTPQEKLQLANWNFELAKQAKKAGMHEYALKLFFASKQLLPKLHWQSLREISLATYTYIGECAFLGGDYETAESHIQEALEHAKTAVEKLMIYRLMTFLYFEEENSDVVMEIGYLAFEECGLKLPKTPNKSHVLLEYTKLKIAMHSKGSYELHDLPTIEKEEIHILFTIIANIISSSFRLDSNLTGILLLRTMRLMLKYGQPPESPIVLINYALMLTVGFQNIKDGTKIGKLAVALADENNDPYIKTRVYFSYGTFVHYWEKDYAASEAYLRKAQHYAKLCGLHSLTSAATCFLSAMQWLQGLPQQTIHENICYEQSKENKHTMVLAKDFLAEFRHWLECTQSATKPNWRFDYTLKSEQAVIAMHHILRLQMTYYYYNEQEALHNLTILKPVMQESFNLVTAPLYYLYRALWQLEWLAKKPPKSLTVQYKRELAESLRKFKKWAKISPQNYEHIYMLLQAENCNRKKLTGEAMLYYDRALQLAKVHHFEQDVALIYERAAKFYAAHQDQVKARDYITRGIEAMHTWGANEIGRLWDERYETYLLLQAQNGTTVSFDLKTVLETTQSLAQEIRMEDLLQKLLFSLLKHASATSGYFICQRQEELQMIAMVEAKNMAFHYFQQGQMPPPHINTIANFVLQCDEHVLISNVAESSLFTKITPNTKSILCVPVRHKRETIAVLYLENTLLINAFNTSQIELIEMVSTQMAVSLENAAIYEDLEHRVAERTKQYEEMNQHLTAVNERLERNEAERKKLFQSISHELRSPITSSLGYIDAILDGIVTDPVKQEEYLNRSRERLLSLNTLIQDLFDLAKLEAGRIDYELSIVSVQDLFESFSARYRDDVEQLQLTYITEGQFNSQHFILIDLVRIEQVVTNLITNARKYTKVGHIKLKFNVLENMLHCSIEDSGIGIPEQDLPFVFDSYFKASNIQQTEDSHGVGLAICKQIIEQHKGTLSVKSIEGIGSTFTFTLPLIEQQG